MEEYKVVNGTYYKKTLPDQIIKVLEECRLNQIRIKLCYGNTKTGRDWQEQYNTCGTIGRSTGICKIPILVHNSRSLGGGAISDSVVRIETTTGKQVLYSHPLYHKG
jgi:hypothetical protein